MAVVDADYKFLMVDIGQMGSVSDGGVWDACTFGHGWNRDLIDVPPASPLPGTTTAIPYVIVGDEAFPLKPNLMRPYPGRESNHNHRKRTYNYRLSRARRVVENAFGILAARWRFLYSPVDAQPERLTVLVNASCVLHNLLCSLSDATYIPHGYADIVENGQIIDGFWRTEQQQQLMNVVQRPARNHTQIASNNREKLADWCSAEGVRDWQDAYITRLN